MPIDVTDGTTEALSYNAVPGRSDDEVPVCYLTKIKKKQLLDDRNGGNF